MKLLWKRSTWIVFAILSILIGIYPLIYFMIDRTFGLLGFKEAELLSNVAWNLAFNSHIILGGFALLIGWIQFNKKFRNKHLQRHRTIGIMYTIAVLFSGLGSLYIACFATGGWVSIIGFFTLGVVWLYTTIVAFVSAKNKNIRRHEVFMIYSYAACFAAVTLRIWLPILVALTGDFIEAYRIVAWICWVPNLLFAYYLIQYKSRHHLLTAQAS